MREIKFRAWDKNKNCWFKPVYEAYKGNLFDLFIELSGNMVVHTSKGIEGNFINSDNNIKFWSDRFELMQYTGLHDKNGKEIYEGDIVKFAPHYSGDDWKKEYIEIIEFEDGSFNYSLCNIGYIDEPAYCEVIGNMHQNPELIK